MNNTPIIADLTQDYIKKYLENAHQVDYTEAHKEMPVTTVLYKDLPHTEVKGYPFASDYVSPDGNAYSMNEFEKLSQEQKAKCELRFYYLPCTHEIYVGTTGSGKTTGCVEPQLRAISSQKNKPNLFVTDPKGELFDHNAQHLKNQGYKTYVLNFKDVLRSDRWNPLVEIYDIKMEENQIGKSAVVKRGTPSSDLKLMASPGDYGRTYIDYKQMAFATEESFDNYLQFERDFLGAKIDGMLNTIAHMMIKVQSSTDKSWEYGAQDLLKGIIKCMLEDASKPSTGFTKEMMTLKTVQEYYLAVKPDIIKDAAKYEAKPLNTYPLLKDKSAKTLALMSTALANAPNTMKSYCGVFDGAMKDWFQGHIFALTTSNTIDIENIDEPYAIFLITRDYDKSDFTIAGLFIDWVYRQAIESTEENKKRRTLHFLLDEFGNIPEIRDFENKISTARSRDVWFHLVVQSYKQIDIVYDQERSVVIRDNCNGQIFLGAQNYETKEIFSKACGDASIPALESVLDPSIVKLSTSRLVPVSQLDLIETGNMYIKRTYSPVITSQFIRSYVCADNGDFEGFRDSHGLTTCTPLIIEAFNGEKFTYKKLTGEVDDDPWDF